MPAHKKTPSQHKTEGTAPKKAAPSQPPLPPVTEFAPPRHLREVAAAEWNRLAPSLVSTGRLTMGDLQVFEAYCLAVERARECDAAISKDGLTSKLSNGAVAPHPLIRVGEKATKTMLDCAVRLGLTPMDRGKVTAASGRDEQAVDDGSVGALGPKPGLPG